MNPKKTSLLLCLWNSRWWEMVWETHSMFLATQILWYSTGRDRVKLVFVVLRIKCSCDVGLKVLVYLHIHLMYQAFSGYDSLWSCPILQHSQNYWWLYTCIYDDVYVAVYVSSCDLDIIVYTLIVSIIFESHSHSLFWSRKLINSMSRSAGEWLWERHNLNLHDFP